MTYHHPAVSGWCPADEHSRGRRHRRRDQGLSPRLRRPGADVRAVGMIDEAGAVEAGHRRRDLHVSGRATDVVPAEQCVESSPGGQQLAATGDCLRRVRLHRLSGRRQVPGYGCRAVWSRTRAPGQGLPARSRTDRAIHPVRRSVHGPGQGAATWGCARCALRPAVITLPVGTPRLAVVHHCLDVRRGSPQPELGRRSR